MTGSLGLSYDLQDSLNLFAGVYRGASLPDPRSYIRSGESLKEESSVSYELGARYQNEAFSATGAIFYSGLSDFIVPKIWEPASKSSRAAKGLWSMTARMTARSARWVWSSRLAMTSVRSTARTSVCR